MGINIIVNVSKELNTKKLECPLTRVVCDRNYFKILTEVKSDAREFEGDSNDSQKCYTTWLPTYLQACAKGTFTN